MTCPCNASTKSTQNLTSSTTERMSEDNDSSMAQVTLRGIRYPGYDFPLLAFFVVVIVVGLANWVAVWYLLRVRSLRRSPINAQAIAMSIVNGLCCILGAPMDLYDVLRSFDEAVPPWCSVKIGTRAFCCNTVKILLFGVALTRLIIGCHTKPIKLNFMTTLAICVVGGIGGGLSLLHNIHPTSTPIRVCLGDVTPGSFEDWSFYFILNVFLFMLTILCYAVLVICLKVRAVLAHSLHVPHNLNDSAVVLTFKSAIGVTAIYSISFLSPFIAKIVHALDLDPEPRYTLHYLAYYSAVIYIQAAFSPLVYLITNQICRQRVWVVLTAVLRPRRAVVVPHVGTLPH